MLIDWFTVGAQALNFLLLVWLMKRFLYRPILHAIATREDRIAAELADADARRAEAQQERAEFQRKNEVFDQQRAARLREVAAEADAERQRRLDEAQRAADALLARQQESLRNDARSFRRAFARRTQQEAFALARQVLADLAATSLEVRMSEVFTQRLRALTDQEKADLVAGPGAATAPALVRSAFALPAEQRAAIQQAVRETCASDQPVRFETATELICGIELTVNGRKVAWSSATYLTSLEQVVADLLGEADRGDPAGAPLADAPAPAAGGP